MAQIRNKECYPRLIDTSAEKQGSDSCCPEKIDEDLESTEEVGRANIENQIQAHLIAEDLKNFENKTNLNITENEENKSVFLKAIELSPCLQGIKKLSSDKAEGTGINSEMKSEVMTIENGHTLIMNGEGKGSEKEHVDPLENKDNMVYKETSEIDSYYNESGHNESTTLKGNANEVITNEDAQIEKSDRDYSSKTKDVHFSSPLAVVHEYKVSQASCSQSTVNLDSDFNDSQNLDDDDNGNVHKSDLSETLSIANDNWPGLLSKAAAATITPGGDCFSVQVNKELDCEKEETPYKLFTQESFLTECQRTDKITDTITLESEDNNQLSLLPVMKETVATETGKESSTFVLLCSLKTPYDLEAGTDLITHEIFNKHSLSSIDSEHAVRASKEMFSEEMIKLSNADIIPPIESLKETCLKNSINELNSAVDIEQDMKVIENYGISGDHGTDLSVAKITEGNLSSHGHCNADTDTAQISQLEVAENSQDLFESSPDQTLLVSNELRNETDANETAHHEKAEAEQNCRAIKDVTAGDKHDDNADMILKDEKVAIDMKQNEEYQNMKDDSQNDLFDSPVKSLKSDTVSEWMEKPENEEEVNQNGNKDQLMDVSVEMKDSSQNDLFESEMVNSDKLSGDNGNPNATKMVNVVMTAQVEDVAKEMEDSSQKDLFESDISSESISPELHISTNQNEIKYNQNQSDEFPNSIKVEDAQISENEDQVNTKIMPSPPEKERVSIETEQRGKELVAKLYEDAANDEIVNKGEKRKANEWAENPPLKSSKVSYDDKQVVASSVIQIAPRKRHSLFKNLDQNESEQPAKRAKPNAPDAYQSETGILSPIFPFGIRTLAEIASDVINTLEEDLIWKNEESYSGVDHFIMSRDEHSKSVSIKKGSSDLQKSVANLNIAAVARLESNIDNLDMNIAVSTNGLEYNRESKEIEIEPVTINDSSNMVTEENSVELPCKPSCLSIESGQKNVEQIRNENGEVPGMTTSEQVTGSPVFVTALEYHSQCSQNSSTGFEPKTVSQDIVMSSQGSDHSIPVVCGKDAHIVTTEVYEEGIETTDLSKTEMRYGSLLDSLVDAAVDHVVPDDLDAEEQLPCPDNTALSMYKEPSEDSKSFSKMYSCDVDICDQEDSPVCKPLDEPTTSLLDMEDRTLSSYSKCFKWKYTPSCDYDPESPLPREAADDSDVVKITPLKTCGKPIRVGLSRRQRVNQLHKFK